MTLHYKLLGLVQRVLILPFQLAVVVMLLMSYAIVNGVRLVAAPLKLDQLARAIITNIPVPKFTQQWNLKTKLLTSLAVNLAMAIIGLIIYWDPLWLILFVLFNQFWLACGVEIGYHRLHAHQSFTCSDPWRKTLSAIGLMSLSAPLIDWTMWHKLHHRYSDAPGDPHPPTAWHTTYSNLDHPDLYKKENIMMVRNLIADPWHLFMKEYYFVLYWMVMIIVCLISFKVAVYCLIMPALNLVLSSTSINYVSHRWGYTLYDTGESSKNNPYTGFWFQGQGQHNNHHYDARSYHTDRLWWEVDFVRPIIRHLIARTVVEARP